MKNISLSEKKSRLFWPRTVGSVVTSACCNLTSRPFLFLSVRNSLHTFISPLLGEKIMSKTELKYTVLSGIFPEILTQKVLIQEVNLTSFELKNKYLENVRSFLCLLDLWHPRNLLFLPDPQGLALSYLDSRDWVFMRETNNQVSLLHTGDAVKFN